MQRALALNLHRGSTLVRLAVTLLPGASTSTKHEVFVQGKHLKAVTDLLLAQGVPKNWIESHDLTAKKK
jgi:translation initiation factor 2D